MKRTRAIAVLTGLFGTLFLPNPAEAATLRVPDRYPSIQAAVDAARAGDTVWVGDGTFCGAIIDKPLHLIARGRARIVGCSDGPALANGARIGFFLPGSDGESPASKTSITGFTFDGRGVSNADLEPIAFGIFGRFVRDARIVGNRFLGTVQAITNTAGDRWWITHNSIEDLTLFDCVGLCTGGDGIVVQPARGSLAIPGGTEVDVNRPEHNWIGFNRITGSAPDGFDVFAMAGILVFSADSTSIVSNWVSIPDNPQAASIGQGIVLTNTCCGLDAPLLPGTRNTFVAFNTVNRSEAGIVVEGEPGANTQGLVLLGNRGSVRLPEAAEAAAQAEAFRFSTSDTPLPSKEIFY